MMEQVEARIANINSSSTPATTTDGLGSYYRQISARPELSQYNRLVALVGIINLLILGYGIDAGQWWSRNEIDLQAIANVLVVNIGIAILIRQQYIINGLFWLATRAPVHWPLWIRWALGKVYHFGGLHSGCATAATLWFIVLTVSMTAQLSNQQPGISLPTVAVSVVISVLLVFIIAMALPFIRRKYHNQFEIVHRFAGWGVLILVWAQTLLFIHDQSVSNEFFNNLYSSLSFWVLTAISISIALPWLRLRKVSIDIQRPSAHAAVVRLNHTRAFPGSSTALSRKPLLEWHSFANIPSPGKQDFRLIISRAGDWTGELIDDLPAKVWVKGITTAGVANIETLFQRVLYVATGSGIGPVMPHLLAKQVPIQLFWSTRSPRKTYGDALVDEILAAQPNAIIWDTDKRGKPDMFKVSHAAYRAFNAEAVICISNQKLTRQVVHEFERRGIPGFGAIWDS